MAKSKDTPYYIGLGIIILIFGYFAVTNVIHYIEKDKVVHSNRSMDRDPVADKFLKKFNKVPDFKFINQNNDTITNQDLLGNVYIVDFFFTTCPTICTPMSTNMAKIVEELKDKNDFQAVSISIDPEYDTPEILKEYASRYVDNDSSWHFLTGNKAETYQLAREGFSAYIGESQDTTIRFEHSGNFALVDREGYIRSRKDEFGNWMLVYRAIQEDDMDLEPLIPELIEDAKTLLNK